MNFDDVISFKSLYKAHLKARLGKRGKKEVVEFEMNLSENLYKLHYDLKYFKYRVSDYYCFTIYDPKMREIQAISYRDRIIQHSLSDNYLMPLLERHLIYDNAACRVNKGVHFCLDRFKNFLRQYLSNRKETGYFIKLDIYKYFASINHDILKIKLKEIVEDVNILNLLYLIINSYNTESGYGIPMGNQTSQNFALLYLNDVDKYIKEILQIKYYVRYMDDMLMIVKNKEIAVEYYKLITQKINLEKLDINPKSQIIKINKGITFLGWKVKIINNKLVLNVKNRTKKRMYLRVSKGVSSQSINSYIGYLKYGNSYNIIKKLHIVELN